MGKIKEHILNHRAIYWILALFTAFNYQLILDLISDWNRDDNYSHGFFIIPLAIYLFYKKKDKIFFPARKSSLGIIGLIIGALIYIIGIAASEYFTTRFGFVLMLTSICLTYLGWFNFRQVWFPFFLLLFMIPIPAIIYYQATMPMQLLASKVSVFLIDFVGVPVARNGNIIILPDNYMLEVAEACSGLRSLVTLMALGALYGYMAMPGKALPVLLFILTIPIAIATNVFRIFATAIGAYAISRELADSFLHELSGIIVFITALIIMLITGMILKWIRNLFLRSSSSSS